MNRIVRVAVSLLWTEVGVRGGWHQVKVTHRQWAVGSGGRWVSKVSFTLGEAAEAWPLH